MNVGYEVCLGISTKRVLAQIGICKRKKHVQYSYYKMGVLLTGQTKLTLSKKVSLESR